MALRKTYNQISQHVPGTRYEVCMNMAEGSAPGEWEIMAILPPEPGMPDAEHDRLALVLAGLSRAKTETIVMILNAPEA